MTAQSGSLTDEQQMAIAKMKQYTDFNDLLINSVLGREGLEGQLSNQLCNIMESFKQEFVIRQTPKFKVEQQYDHQGCKI